MDDLVPRPETHIMVDEDSGQSVEITPQLQAAARAMHQRLNASVLITALILKKISDDKLYLALGCGTFKEYANTMLPFSEFHAKKYLRIARTFEPVLGEFELKGASMHLSEESNSAAIPEEFSELSSLGIVKLYELTKIEDADFTEVMSKGVVKLPDGREFDLDDIKDESARKAVEQIRAIRKEYGDKLAVAEAERRAYRDERDHYKAQLERDSDKVERAYELEAKYGKEAGRLAEVEYLLEQTRTYLAQAERYFGRVEIADDDPEGLQEDARSIMRRINAMQVLAIRRFSWFNELQEMDLLPSVLLKNPHHADESLNEGER